MLSVANKFQNLLSEEMVKTLIKNRTRAKKIELIITRLILFIINISLVGGGWVAIFLVNTNQSEIKTYMTQQFTWLKYVSTFIPSLCLAAVNILLPMITNRLIEFERWDYASTVINNQIWRNFLAKEFNIILFFLVNIDMIVPYNIIPNSSNVVQYNAAEYPCPEVQISVEFLKLLAIEIVVYVISQPLKFIFFWIFASC